MNKHTPGPWHWVNDSFRDGYHGLYSGDVPVIVPQHENDGDDGAAWFGTDTDYYGDTALSEANANLIAAAPDLLEALEKAVNRQGFTNDELIAARKAIAKAKGETMAERQNNELTINGKQYKACQLKMVEIYGGKDDAWKGWHNLILDLGGPEFDKPIAGPIDPETSVELKVSIAAISGA